MVILTDAFLVNLQDLSDNEATLQLDETKQTNRNVAQDIGLDDIEALNYDDLDAIAKLQKTSRYHDIVKKVEAALAGGSYGMQQDKKKWPRGCIGTNEGSLAKDDHQYHLIMECNTLATDIENETSIIHSFIRDKYTLKFPELESLVFHPIDYARIVKRIGNEMDLNLVNLDGLLPSATIMVLSVIASTTTGKPLSKEDLQKTLEACDKALDLDDVRKKLLDFVESRMDYVAPNLSAIVGVVTAAKLMGAVGGLEALSKMPACNLQVLGAKKKITNGFSTSSSFMHIGFVMETDVVQSTPPSVKMRACRLVAGKAILAARVDETKGDPTGKTGENMRDDIRKKIEKWQELPPPRQPKPLPVPYSTPKKKRGGRRLRKMKERYALTDMQRLENRMQFGVFEESSLGDGIGKGYGMQGGSGKLRVSKVQRKLAAKVTKKPKNKSYVSNSIATSGLISSLAFTPVQGIELTNPQADASLFNTHSRYFC